MEEINFNLTNQQVVQAIVDYAKNYWGLDLAKIPEGKMDLSYNYSGITVKVFKG